MIRNPVAGMDRRTFLARVGWWPLVAAALFSTAAGCGRGEEGPAGSPEAPPAGRPPSAEDATAAPAEAAPAAATTAPPENAPKTGEQSAAPAPEEAAPGGERLVTEIAAMQPMVTALKYTNESPETDQRCSNCRFYTPRDDAERGACQLFPQGVVTAAGWCASWQQRPPAA
ncbi:MAG TPA: hypothetical protein ENO23_04160 [Alphaproteobacteria bacterium]|nr:hypothetical protein [Alphaproteobacteria bacterium]